MYLSAGWPSNFDSLEFDRLRQSREDAITAQHHAETPVNMLAMVHKWIIHDEEQRQRLSTIEQQLANDPPSDEAETARLVQRQASIRDFLDLHGVRWAREQEEMRKRVSEQKASLEDLLLRRGGYAEMADEVVEDIRMDLEKRIAEDEAWAADESTRQRHERLLRMYSAEAAKVPERVRATWEKGRRELGRGEFGRRVEFKSLEEVLEAWDEGRNV